MLATVWLLTVVGEPAVLAAEPSQASPSLVIPVAADGVQRAAVTLDSYSYSPNHLIVEAGKPVELTLISVTTITPHNFIIKDPAGSLFVEQEVSAGKTVTITFTPIQPAPFLSTAINGFGPCRAIETRGWKGPWKYDRYDDE